MSNFEKIEKALKKDWYIQGFNAVPIFLNHAAYSGFTMKQELGFGYSEFLFHYQNGYGEMWYLNSDFRRIWQAVKEELRADPSYLIKLKRRYTQRWRSFNQVYAQILTGRFKKFNDRMLVRLLKKAALAAVNSVGSAHAIDAVGIELDKELKTTLAKQIKSGISGKEFNYYYNTLTQPSKKSFLTAAEDDLQKIAVLYGEKQQKAFERHVSKYFWIENSYAGPKFLNVNDFKKRIKQWQKSENRLTSSRSLSAKLEIIRELKLTQEVKEKLNLIDCIAIWQDERKAGILKSIGCLALVIQEIAKRASLAVKLFDFLGVMDIKGLQSLSELKKLEPELMERQKGVFVLMTQDKEIFVSGAAHDKLLKIKQSLEDSEKVFDEELHGSIANMGTAIGKVVVCKNLDSLKKVKAGDILVASMTRPEFMVALKKAAAIVTDEGGITSHAAVVARELGIPAVIGTKVATRVLKDGMKVEVRANHGVVRILK